MKETHSWRGQVALQDVLYVPAPVTSVASAGISRADASSLSSQFSALLAAPPMLSLAERGGVKDWEAKWALRDQKLHEIQMRLRKSSSTK
jgi:hypothetical protein